jgi:hypothetical protein
MWLTRNTSIRSIGVPVRTELNEVVELLQLLQPMLHINGAVLGSIVDYGLPAHHCDITHSQAFLPHKSYRAAFVSRHGCRITLGAALAIEKAHVERQRRSEGGLAVAARDVDDRLTEPPHAGAALDEAEQVGEHQPCHASGAASARRPVL